ncbi:hypothetical protein MRX96_051462, partial [Rhipicephalus microplus]
MHRPNWLRFFVTQLVVLSWQPFPVRIERQPVGVLQDAGVPHPGPADTLNSDYSFHEDGRDGCMPAQTVCAESSARQAHLWWYGPRMDRTYYVLSATSILPSPLEKSIKPGETIAATSGPGGTLRMHRPNWLRFFVTQLVVLSWQPFPVRIERQPVGVLQDAGVPHPGPADTLNSDYSFHEDGRDGCMPAQTVCAESSARQAHLWWYGPRMDRTYYVLSATSILPSPLEKSIKPGETIAATSGPGGTLRMHRPNWLRFFVTQLVVLSWQPFPVRIERQPVGVLQDAGVPHPGPADTLNSDYSFHEDGRDGCMPAQTVCAESSARQAHLWWYGPRMDRTYYVLSATSILPSPLEKSIKPGETIAATSGPGGTLRMHRPNWLRFFVTQLVVLSWQPFPVRIERQPVGVLQDAGVPHPGPADTLNSDYSFHEDGRDGCMPAQTVCAESSARQAHLW